MNEVENIFCLIYIQEHLFSLWNYTYIIIQYILGFTIFLFVYHTCKRLVCIDDWNINQKEDSMNTIYQLLLSIFILGLLLVIPTYIDIS